MTQPVGPLPLAVQDLTLGDLDQRTADAAVVRIGVVTRYDVSGMTVRISGSDVLVDAAYLTSYQPILGENVAVVKAGASWLALGGLSATPPDNPVVNYSFELDELDVSPPSGWAWLNDPGKPGAPIVKVDFSIPILDGGQCGNVNGIAVVGDWRQLLYSAPIAVDPGQQWSASAYTTWYTNTSTTGGTTTMLLFFHDTTLDVPTFAMLGTDDAADLAVTFVSGDPFPQWVLMTQQRGADAITVPAGKHAMRVVLMTDTIGSLDVFFDRVIARRVA